MKILVAVVDSQVGGVTTAAINFCNELQQRGNDVFFLDMSERYLCANALHKEIQIGKLAGKSKYWNLKHTGFYFRAMQGDGGLCL